MAHPHWAGVLRMVVVDDRPPDGPQSDFFLELQAAGVTILHCTGGADALIRYGQCAPDAVLLPVHLPDVPAVEVVAAMRREGNQPILVAADVGDFESAGPVLMAGASTALARPYRSREVVDWLARALPDLPPRDQLSFGPLTLDPLAHTVRVGHRELDQMPLKEFTLLELLMAHADHVVPLEKIKATLWAGGQEPRTNTVTVHVQRLRRRLPAGVELLTVRGLGYRLTAVSSVSRPVGPADTTMLRHNADRDKNRSGTRSGSLAGGSLI